jgi:hypothetical protein
MQHLLTGLSRIAVLIPTNGKVVVVACAAAHRTAIAFSVIVLLVVLPGEAIRDSRMGTTAPNEKVKACRTKQGSGKSTKETARQVQNILCKLVLIKRRANFES